MEVITTEEAIMEVITTVATMADTMVPMAVVMAMGCLQRGTMVESAAPAAGR
jgi:uncharacterized Fe-S cluster-containing MiaB family protein